MGLRPTASNIAHIFSHMGSKSEPRPRRVKTSCPSAKRHVHKRIGYLYLSRDVQNMIFLSSCTNFLCLAAATRIWIGCYTRISPPHRETTCGFSKALNFGTTRLFPSWIQRGLFNLASITSPIHSVLLSTIHPAHLYPSLSTCALCTPSTLSPMLLSRVPQVSLLRSPLCRI